MAALESHAVSGTCDRPTSALLFPLLTSTRLGLWLLASASRILLGAAVTPAHLAATCTLLINVLGFAPGLRIVVAFLCVRKERASNSHLPSVAASNTAGQT